MRVTSAPPTAQDRTDPEPESGDSVKRTDDSLQEPLEDEVGREDEAGAEGVEPAEAASEAAEPAEDSQESVPRWQTVAAGLSVRAAVLARRPEARDVAACLGLILLASWLTRGLLADPTGRALALNVNDQALDEWFLANGTRIFTGQFHLVTHLLNVPDGVNLLSNASLMLLGVIMSPITLAFGAPVTFALVVAGNFAATAAAWYLLMARTLRLHRFGALVGGAFCGFAPGMMSQANAHLHISAQWLVPPIVWCLIRLVRTDDEVGSGEERVRRVLSTGGALGALISAQLFLGEEVLFLCAFTLAVYCAIFAVLAPRRARTMLWPVGAGLATAGLVALIILAYPLWLQFAGPQHVPNGPFSARFFSADLASFTAISPLSFAGDPSAARLASGPAEYTTFFGLPLLLVAAGAALWLWRRPVALAAALATVVMCALSLGPRLLINGVRTDRHGPFSPLEGLPVLDGALPTRFALAAIPLLALLLAFALDAALVHGPDGDPAAIDGRLRLLVPVAVIAALVPIAPTAMPTTTRNAVPRFFTEGYWRTCVSRDGVLVPVPPPEPNNPDAMRWAAAANDEFAIPEGFFIGPYADGGRASIGTYPTPTSELMHRVARTGEVPNLSDNERAMVAQDLDFWGASCVVLADQPHKAELRTMLDYLIGPGEDVADVHVWKVLSHPR
jgi:hypothetical protein